MTEGEMQDNAARIAELKAVPPVVLARAHHLRRVAGLAISAFALAVVAITIGVWLLYSKAQTGTCVNDQLADRSRITASNDSTAIAQAESQLSFLKSLAGQSLTPSEFVAFVAQSEQNLAVLKLNQEYRLTHPLGSC